MLFIADLVISAIRFAEAEVKAFRRGMFRVILAVIILLVAGICFLTAFGMAVAGLYLLLLPGVGSIGAAFIVSIIAAIVAAILALIAWHYVR